MQNIAEILRATGAGLLTPLRFGKFSGHYLWDLPQDYLQFCAQCLGVDKAVIDAKVSDALTLKRQQKASTAQRADVILPADLYQFQRAFIVEHGGASRGLGAEMATGKTRTIIELLKTNLHTGRCAIVVAPKTVLDFDTWQTQLDRWQFAGSVMRLDGSTKRKIDTLMSANRSLYLVNYDAFLSKDFVDAVCSKRPQIVILDESHKIKTHNAKRTKALHVISHCADQRYCLTGTPITNSKTDIWSQSYFIDHGAAFGKTFSQFYNQYFQRGSYSYYGGPFRPDKEMAYESTMSKTWTVIRRRDVIELPDKIHETREVELSADAVGAYKQIVKDQILPAINDDEKPIQHKIVEILRLRQVTGGYLPEWQAETNNKLDALIELIDDISPPVVVVAFYRAEIDAIMKRCKAENITAAAIHGGIDSEGRRVAGIEFMAGHCDVLILQPTAAAEGLDGLQHRCSTMIFYSQDYQWDKRQQIEDRLMRPGQKNKVLYIDILATIKGKPTIDHQVAGAVMQKDFEIRSIIDAVKTMQGDK